VVDPVMVAKGGAQLLELDAVQLFIREIIPQSYLLTPNLPEAERLLSRRVQTLDDMERAARELHAMGAANVLIKGGIRPEQRPPTFCLTARACTASALNGSLPAPPTAPAAPFHRPLPHSLPRANRLKRLFEKPRYI